MAFETALMTINSEMVFMPIPTQEIDSIWIIIWISRKLVIVQNGLFGQN